MKKNQKFMKDVFLIYLTNLTLNVGGLLIGARGSISKFVVEFFQNYNLYLSLIEKISLSVIKDSLLIYNYHVFCNN